jgi:hypothetical protein
MPEMKHWREDPDEELARLIPTNKLTDFWTTNIHTVVEPGETAVLIKDGAIQEVLTQQRISNLAGGFGNWLSKKMAMDEKFDILMVDNKPFRIEIGVEGMSMDDVAQTGTAKLMLRLNHENSNRIIGVLREKAIKVKKGFFRKRTVVEGFETFLTRSSIEQMLAEEARAKVFRKVINKYHAKDLGNNAEVDDDVSTSLKIELRKTLDLWGMSIEDAFVNWSPNAYQSWKAQRAPTTWLKRAQLEDKESDDALDFEFDKKRMARDSQRDDLDFAAAKKRKLRGLEEEDVDFEIAKKRKIRERELRKMERDFDDDDEFSDLSKKQKQLAIKKQIAMEEAKMEAELAEMKAGSSVKVQSIESQGDAAELEKLLGVKQKMSDQKMARKSQDQKHELEMARLKADVDKTVGVAQATATAEVLRRKTESKESKKNVKRRS